MDKWLYSFAAKEIQKYILQGDKLKDMVGGSELINHLCQDFVGESLDRLGINKSTYTIIAQAAGWAKILFNDASAANRFFTCWPLLAERFAPGLQIVQALVKVDNSLVFALGESEKRLSAERNLVPAEMPEIGPLIERNPRTGMAAVRYSGKEDQLQDRQTVRKRHFLNKDALVRKMTGGGMSNEIQWPVDMDHIAGSEKKYLAVIHADGNDLGKTIIQIQKHLEIRPEVAGEAFEEFSAAIEETTLSAVKVAYQDVLKKDHDEEGREFIAARPLVLGGDDLSIIVRSDLAFEFVRIFLEAFETQSGKSLKKRLGKFDISGLPSKLTSCAGIAFVKKAYPFSRAYDLAESMCSYAKKIAKDRRDGGFVPSCFSFYKVTSSIAGDYGEIMDKDLTSRDRSIRLWRGPYGVGRHAAMLAKYENLKELSEVLSAFPSGSVRTLITTLYSNGNKAKADFDRILEIAKRSDKGKQASKLQNVLTVLTSDEANPLWDRQGHSPLLDAHRMKELLDNKA